MLDVRQLTQLPRRAEDVCSLIGRFAEDWTGHDASPAAAESATADTPEIAAAEQRLGAPLPTALRWLYTTYPTDGTPLGTQDRLLGPEELTADRDSVVTLIEENQQCAAWGYKADTTDPQLDDPAVLWKDLQGLTEAADTWQAYQPRLSVHLLEAAFNAAMLAENALTVHRELDPANEPDLSAALPLAIPEHVFWADPSAAPVRWYALEDVLIRNDGGTWLWALPKTKEALQRLRSTLPGEWEPFEG